MRTIALVLVSLVAFTTAEDEAIIPEEVTIDAAFRYEGVLFLIVGDKYMAVGPDGFESYIKDRAGDTKVPVGETIQAAVRWPLKPIVYYFGNMSLFRTLQEDMISRHKAYMGDRWFLENGGPDAVGYKDGYFYIFRGCQYVSQTKTLWHLGEPKNTTDLDLPCNPDAAWPSTDLKTMTVLKGDKIWVWTGDKVEGPKDFSDDYHIWSWQLKPTPDDRFQL